MQSREKVPRESILLKEFTQCITYLNQFLPDENRIHYIAWDMSRASHSREEDVIETLEHIADQVLKTTGFFHNGSDAQNYPSMQNGVCRTNCIDCLDRTNAAQFVIGKRALGHQLHALGVINDTSIEYDTDAVNLFTHMYHDHGDTVAVQYAGSHLVNTMETYRKINQWTSHPRDMLESFRRYYNNSFLDEKRQEAINLFLGNYIPVQGQPMLWDLTTDYYLHHIDPRQLKKRRSYVRWWTPKNLERRVLPGANQPTGAYADRTYTYFDDYWLEYYNPKVFSSINHVFPYKLNSTAQPGMAQDGRYDLSPFKVRINYTDSVHGDLSQRKKKKRKSVKIALQIEDTGSRVTEVEEDAESWNEKLDLENNLKKQSPADTQLKRMSLQSFPWPSGSSSAPPPAAPSTGTAAANGAIAPFTEKGWSEYNSTSMNPGQYSPTHPPFPTLSPTKSYSFSSATATPGPKPHAQMPMDDIITRLLAPSVSPSDADEYSRYMLHPLNLPLVTSSSSPALENTQMTTRHYADFVNYVNLPSQGVENLVVKDEDLQLYRRFVRLKEQQNALGVEGEYMGGANGGMWKKRYKAYQTWLNTGKLKNTAGGGGGPGVGPGASLGFAGGVAGGLRQAMAEIMETQGL